MSTDCGDAVPRIQCWVVAVQSFLLHAECQSTLQPREFVSRVHGARSSCVCRHASHLGPLVSFAVEFICRAGGELSISPHNKKSGCPAQLPPCNARAADRWLGPSIRFHTDRNTELWELVMTDTGTPKSKQLSLALTTAALLDPFPRREPPWSICCCGS